MRPLASLTILLFIGTAPGAAGAPSGKIAAPEREIAGAPLWLGRDRVCDRVVILVEGFDFHRDVDAADMVERGRLIAEPLWNAGIDLVALDFPDAAPGIEVQAGRLAEVVRAVARDAGRPVAIVGFSAGGMTARWALAQAEAAGAPLPVATCIYVDTPHRGAWLNAALMALSGRYGGPGDRAALGSPAARELLRVRPENLEWRRIGVPVIPDVRRRVPARWRESSAEHQAFLARLRALGPNRGYPSRTRNVAVALGSRRSVSEPSDLLHLWLPFGSGWTLRADPRDLEPGSLLPDLLARRLQKRVALGIAGIHLRRRPTFIPTESALDAGPDERPPFDSFYARPDGAPAIAHDHPDSGAGLLILRELAQTFAR